MCASVSVEILVCICCYCELVGVLGVLVFMLVLVDWECTVAGIIKKKKH